MRVEYMRGPSAHATPVLPAVPPARPVSKRTDRRLMLATLGIVIFTLLLFLFLRSDLISIAEELRTGIL
jgi:hypothetical protein